MNIQRKISKIGNINKKGHNKQKIFWKIYGLRLIIQTLIQGILNERSSSWNENSIGSLDKLRDNLFNLSLGVGFTSEPFRSLDISDTVSLTGISLSKAIKQVLEA